MLDKFFKSMYFDLVDAEDLFRDAVNRMTSEPKDEKNNDENASSYFHFISNKYEDGKCVDHQEKIIDNGKVIKDEHKSIDNKKEETKAIEGKELQVNDEEINSLKAENEKLKEENEYLKKKIDHIKDAFKF